MKKKARRWILQVVNDPDSDDLMLEFPDELLKAANLKTGDVVNWKVDGAHVILETVDKDFPLTSL